MSDPSDAKGRHAREFTNHELLTLRVWFDLDAAGQDELAERVLEAGLMLEHYTSLLANDPAERTSAEVANQATLAFEFDRALRAADEFFRGRRERTDVRLGKLAWDSIGPYGSGK